MNSRGKDAFDLGAQKRGSHLQSRLILGDTVGQASPPQWLLNSYQEFRRHVTDPEYPCFFGSRAEQAGHLFYTYCEHARSPMLPRSVQNFIKLKRESEHFDTNLAVFLAPEPDQRSHDYYRNRLWQLLSHLHANDNQAWPEEFPIAPEETNWEFTFGGEQFFIFSTSPSYRLRKSRNLGVCQILMMQPRSSFDVLSSNANGAGAREKVRQRIRAWDDVGVHPDLGVYGDPASREWKQYFLPDDMTPEAGQCPFRHQLEQPAVAEDEIPEQQAIRVAQK